MSPTNGRESTGEDGDNEKTIEEMYGLDHYDSDDEEGMEGGFRWRRTECMSSQGYVCLSRLTSSLGFFYCVVVYELILFFNSKV